MSLSDPNPSPEPPAPTKGIRRIAAPGDPLPAARTAPARRAAFKPWMALALTAFVFALWLAGTPAGLDGKAWAVGYAVCHQIPARTFFIAGEAGARPMPLCARCTGIYIGVMVGFLAPALLLRAGRAGRLPGWPALAMLGLFTLVMVVDGLNSFLNLFPAGAPLYQPFNGLRLVTGSLHGLTMASLIYPIFNQTVWRDWRPRRSLRHLGDLAVLVSVALALDLLALTREPLALAALGYLTTLGVIVILMAISTTILVAIMGRERMADGWGDLVIPLIVAFGVTVIVIGMMDAGRFALFGSWSGIALTR